MIRKNKRKRGLKEVIKGEKALPTSFRLSSKTYFLTFKGNLETKIDPQKNALFWHFFHDSQKYPQKQAKIDKKELANYLLNSNPSDLKLKPIKYLVCQEMYDSGEPHFHAILIYPKRKEIKNPHHFDYLGIHPNIQTMRNMKAALDYVYKEDPNPITNMNVIQQRRIAKAKDTSSLYQLLQQQMLKDPFNFDLSTFCEENELFKHIYKSNYTKAFNLLKMAREARCNSILYNKPGFKYIDRTLIQKHLSSSELRTFDSWKGYQTIVNYLNQIPTYRFKRPAKTMNLLITGPSSIGKSALVWQTYPTPPLNPLNVHVSVYPMGMKDWFPQYKSEIYDLIYWNEANLTSYKYDVILQLLDGSVVMLPSKGGGHKKIDNPLVLMTSNMTLDQMIQQKFSYNKTLKLQAKKTFSTRVQNVIVPKGYDLFLIQKLLITASKTS